MPFCTIDPPDSMDLDQAMHLERSGRGYRVRYALACLPACLPAFLAAPPGLRVGHAARGGASLPLPNQVVTQLPDGQYEVSFRPPVDAEDWNAQISLLTGMAAAQLMLSGGIGMLRTMPPASRQSVGRLRQAAQALGVPWSPEQGYGVFLRSLDREDNRHLALMHEAATLFRGAGYTAFDGSAPEQREHAAVASSYAHVTAPLRRLGDRFCLALCASLSSGEPVPDWVRATLPALPAIMNRADQLAGSVNRLSVEATEASILRPFIGQPLDGVVVDDHRGGDSAKTPSAVDVQLLEHAVIASAEGNAASGDAVSVAVGIAEVASSTVRLRILADAGLAG